MLGVLVLLGASNCFGLDFEKFGCGGVHLLPTGSLLRLNSTTDFLGAVLGTWGRAFDSWCLVLSPEVRSENFPL